MIDREHDLPITHQARTLGISRGSVYYLPRPVTAADLAIMLRMDELHLEFPFAGSRMLRDLLNREGIEIGRRHVAALMKLRQGRPLAPFQSEHARLNPLPEDRYFRNDLMRAAALRSPSGRPLAQLPTPG